MVSATNERTIAKAKKRAADDALTDKTVIQALMRDVSGRRWVWLRLGEAQIFVESSNLDHAYMAYEKGLRNAGLRLLAAVTRHAPNDYITMTRENSPVDLKEDTDGGNADSDSDD